MPNKPTPPSQTVDPPRKLVYNCSYCAGTFEKLQICSKCRLTRYCSTRCQKAHWDTHRHRCIPEIVKGIRIPSRGDRSKNPGAAIFQSVDVPRSHPIYNEGHSAPVSKKIGVPLLVYRGPQSLEDLQSGIPLVNQETTYLMIDPVTAFAPMPWQDNIGTSTLIRADHQPLTPLEIEVIWEYMCLIIGEIGEENGDEKIKALMFKERFQRFCVERKAKGIRERRGEFAGLKLPIGRG